MSRSYKKYPIVRQERVDKHRSNRYIRHNIDCELPPRGSSHKRIHQDGFNWAYYWTLEDAKQTYFESEWAQSRFSTLEEYLIWYKKTTLRK